MKVGGSHEMVELRTLHGGSKAVSRIRILNFWRTNFSLSRDLLRGIPWDRRNGSPRISHYLSTTSFKFKTSVSP